MSSHALASLTANYSDSEDEDDGLSPAASPSPTSQSRPFDPDAGVEEGDCDGEQSHSQGSRSSSNSNSNSNLVQQPPPSSVNTTTTSKSTLVSYHDHEHDHSEIIGDIGIEGQIDDEAIDDYPHSGSNASSREELEKDSLSLPNSPGQGLELMDTDMSLPLQIEAGDTDPTAANPDDITGSDSPMNPNPEDLSDPKRSKLPPEPQGKPDPKLQEKFAKMYQQKLAGSLNMNDLIQKRKMFRNPSIYEKLISHLNIDEFGTNYPESAYNPHEWPESSFYDELAKAQKIEMDRREKERKDRTKVEFMSGTVKKPTGAPGSGGGIPMINPAPSVGSGADEHPPAKRKSKWDQKGVMPPLLGMTGGGGGGGTGSSQQPITIPPSIVSSVAAAAKAKTLINAFGNLPKRK